MTKAEKRVIAAAMLVWKTQKPVAWTHAEHLLQPTVNSPSKPLKMLALACAALAKEGKKC